MKISSKALLQKTQQTGCTLEQLARKESESRISDIKSQCLCDPDTITAELLDSLTNEELKAVAQAATDDYDDALLSRLCIACLLRLTGTKLETVLAVCSSVMNSKL